MQYVFFRLGVYVPMLYFLPHLVIKTPLTNSIQGLPA